jgi:hypothetical protein
MTTTQNNPTARPKIGKGPAGSWKPFRPHNKGRTLFRWVRPLSSFGSVLFEGVLDLLASLLYIALGLVGLALGLQAVVARDLQVGCGAQGFPERDWHAISCLAAVISRFDVVAVQESRRNPNAHKRLLAILGPQWQVIISDVTEGSAGNSERLAFLYDSARVQPSGMVGEIALPPPGDDLQRQFARSPYTASFARAGIEFVLASVHVLWGSTRLSGCRRSPPSQMDAGLGRPAQRLEHQPHGAWRLQPGPDR